MASILDIPADFLFVYGSFPINPLGFGRDFLNLAPRRALRAARYLLSECPLLDISPVVRRLSAEAAAFWIIVEESVFWFLLDGYHYISPS
jgi:hypothetical protein